MFGDDTVLDGEHHERYQITQVPIIDFRRKSSTMLVTIAIQPPTKFVFLSINVLSHAVLIELFGTGLRFIDPLYDKTFFSCAR